MTRPLPRFNSIAPRGCPGSYAVPAVTLSTGKGLCPYCGHPWLVRDDGTIKGHKKPKEKLPW
jgi:hypothetical protein